MTIAFTALIGLGSSLLASLLFLRYLSTMKPKLLISKKIAKEKIGKTFKYSIKIINKTRTPILNVRFRLDLITKCNSSENLILKEELIHEYYIFHLDKFKKKDKESLYAFRFNVDCDKVDNKWTKKNEYLKLTVIANHSVSNFTKVFEMNYRNKESDIVTGTYKCGDSLDIDT